MSIFSRRIRRSILTSCLVSIAFAAHSESWLELTCTSSGQRASIITHDEVAPVLTDAGYRHYGGASCQALIDRHWNRFNMKKTDWNQGAGYEDACNMKLPLNRAFRQLEALKISGGSGSQWVLLAQMYPEVNLLQKAYGVLDDAIIELRLGCGANTTAWALSTHSQILGDLLGDHKITLWLKHFGDESGRNVIDATATLAHESMHRWKRHNAADSACPGGRSCDTEWSYGGANTYHVLWLWSYSHYAYGAQHYLRVRALDQAKFLADNRFAVNPQINWPGSVPLTEFPR